jgi:hypothetical protein
LFSVGFVVGFVVVVVLFFVVFLVLDCTTTEKRNLFFSPCPRGFVPRAAVPMWVVWIDGRD